jgi:predicted DNA repair protein MutK
VSGGLVALLDDVAALAKLAAASVDDVGAAAGKASAKAVGVVVDDTAVTPNYVRDFAAARELPMIKKIAVGSLRNKIVFILPVAMLLSQFLPQAMTWLLLLGGTYLAFEGAEKVYGALAGHHEESGAELAAAPGTPEHEKLMVSGAIRTDFILSAEIMAISLAEVAHEPFVSRAIILVVVAIAITILVYGVVAVIVKMDDIGLKLAERQSKSAQRIGLALVKAMPKVMTVLGIVGTAAMLWVGGHIIIVNIAEIGWHAPLDVLHHLEEAAAHALPAVGGVVSWVVETLGSAVLGIVVGMIIVGVMHLIPRRKKAAAH